MTYETLKKIAEALDTVALEALANKEINNYSIEIIPDDKEINMVMMKAKPIKSLKVNLKIAKKIQQ